MTKNATFYLYFFNFVYNLLSLRIRKTIINYSSCFALLLEYTKLLSMNAKINLSKNDLNILFIRFMNVVGTLINPKGIIKNP